MSTKQLTIDYLTEQIEKAGAIRSRKMFGEYALYCNEKVIAFVCDDQLFIKRTEEGKKFIGKPKEAPAYPGSKMYYLIEGDLWENSEWLSELVRVTAEELPTPKSKKK
mgnify:CR=1 FL=1